VLRTKRTRDFESISNSI